MDKQMAKRIIIQYLYNQEKLHWFSVKIVEIYDVGKVETRTSIGSSPADAVERLKAYYQTIYEIPTENMIVRLNPKPNKDNK